MAQREAPRDTDHELDLRADGEHRYLVTVTDPGGQAREHRVSVPPSLLDELNLEAPDEPVLVRTGLELMVRHAGDRVPEEIRLDDTEGYCPGLLEHLRSAVGR